MGDCWITGTFEGDYVGYAGSNAPRDGDRRYRIELVRGLIKDPKRCAQLPEGRSLPVRQAALRACYFNVGQTPVPMQCPLYDIELHDWQRLESHESGSTLYGRLQGRLYGRLAIADVPSVSAQPLSTRRVADLAPIAPTEQDAAARPASAVTLQPMSQPAAARLAGADLSTTASPRLGCFKAIGILYALVWVSAVVTMLGKAVAPSSLGVAWFMANIGIMMFGNRRARRWAWFSLVIQCMYSTVS